MLVYYRSVKPVPTDYFRQEITVYVNLSLAGKYLLWQGLFYNHTRTACASDGAARHKRTIALVFKQGSGGTEVAQTLLYKNDKIIQSKTKR